MADETTTKPPPAPPPPPEGEQKVHDYRKPPEPPDLEATIPGAAPPKPRGRPRGTAAATAKRKQTAAQFRDQLAGGTKAVSLGILMASGQAPLLNNPGIVDAIDSRCDKFAAAWAAVAEQDPRVARWMETLMSGGVWAAAIAQTGSLVVMLGVMSGKLRVPLGTVAFVVPELAPYLTVTQPAEPPSAEASQNGPAAEPPLYQ